MFQKSTLIKVLIFILAVAAIVFIYQYASGFVPIILAFLTALMLEPLVKFIQKRGKFEGRLPAVAISFVVYVLLLASIIYLTVTKIFQQLIRLLNQLPNYISDVLILNEYLATEINRLIADIPQKHLIINEIEKQGEVLLTKVSVFTQNLIPIIASSVQALPALLVIFIVYLITVFLFSLDLPLIIKKFYGLFKEETAEKIAYVFDRLGNVVVGFFKAQFLVSIVIFIASYIGLLIIAPERAFIMAIIIWIIDVIPFIGSILVLAPWILYSLLLGNTSLAVKLIILQIVLLALRRTLEPKIMGRHIGLAALPTLLSMYFGIYFLGIVGLVLGPIIFIAVKSAYEAKIFTINYKL
ncbi:sporulation integral membrane protein YtvI [Desulfuribacillus alkaliarsenatis]|uniref:Sporulation integral membrane protein YtvI n=1 Tax=Desulfuribacillus alkaliarsenatis TaxID=766136 RepID=A0A1E5G120_9FIRM|nr:sporulation integral membrane protein YtvI [Desulfuribacillus alkaliarsenatis]OEF96593.1 sporulation integral membrane protein YtvI [Desulfuribacillus alkaliarsenatis]